MKIKIIRYPYNEHQVGDLVDFGDEKNASLVSFERAVWYLGDQKKQPVKPAANLVDDVQQEQPPLLNNPLSEDEDAEEKKFLQNELQAKVQAKKAEIEANQDDAVEAPIVEPKSETTGTSASLAQDEPEEKKFLQNELAEEVEEKKSKSTKKSFWDKLK